MTRRGEQLVSLSFFALALVSFAWAGYLYFAPEPGAQLEPIETDIEVAGGVAGAKMDVPLRFINRSGRPMRVLGMGFC